MSMDHHGVECFLQRDGSAISRGFPFTFVSALCVLVFFTQWHVVGTVDVKPRKEVYTPDYSVYHNLTSIQTELQRLVYTFPHFMKINWNYKSRLGKSQMLLQVTNFTRAVNSAEQPVRKVKMLLSYGEHAREFLPVETMLFLLKNLTQGLRSPEGSPSEAYSRFVLSNVDLHLIAVANPDGRLYVESSHNYCWRGTSTGVDLNRNFNWEYGKKGSSSDPSDEEYRGPHAFSEPESYIFQYLTQEKQFDLFTSFHSGIRQIYLPYADTYSHTSRRQPANIQRMNDLAAQLATSTRHPYQYGKAYDLTFYSADGTSFDFMAGVRKIPFSLAIELWGSAHHVGASCFDEFNPRSESLQHELAEIHPLYVALFDYMINWKLHKTRKPAHAVIIEKLPSSQNTAPSHTLRYLLMATVAMVIILLVIQGRVLFCPWWQHRRRVIRLKTLSSTLSLWGFVKSM